MNQQTKQKKYNPSTKGDNGRDAKGRFVPGWKGGPGNPHAAAVGAWRSALAEAVTPEDIRQVTDKLVSEAKAGESWAVRELLDRCLGKPTHSVEVEATGQTWLTMLAALEAAGTKED